jgi:predicted RNase H-like nuclease (RuvC/YqgF family)
MEQKDLPIDITTQDVQAVMQKNSMFTLQVQNQALQRMVIESIEQINHLRKELDQFKHRKSGKGS